MSSLLLILSGTSLGLFLPVLSLMYLDNGVSMNQLALVTGVFSATVIISSFPGGVFSDTFGRKRAFLLSQAASIGFLTVMYLGQGVALMMIAVFFRGIHTSFLAVSLNALVIQQAVDEQGTECLPKVTRRIAILNSGGISIGALLGGSLSAGLGYESLLMTAFVLSAAQILICVFSLKEGRAEKQSADSFLSGVKQRIGFVAGNRAIKCILACVTACGTLLFVIESYWQPAYRDISNGPEWALGLITFGGFAASMIGCLISSRLLSRRKNWLGFYFIVRIALSLAFLLFAAVISSGTSFVAGYALVYLLLGMGEIPESSVLNAEVPGNLRSSVMSLTSLAIRLGGLLSSLISGLFLPHFGIAGIWRMAALILAAVTLSCAIFIKKGKSTAS